MQKYVLFTIAFIECKVEDEGLQYMGQMNMTLSGKSCQAWSSQSPHEHTYTDDSMYPDGSIGGIGNRCRNPDDNEPGGPWCFTTESGTRWEYCDVPKCGQNTFLFILNLFSIPNYKLNKW